MGRVSARYVSLCMLSLLSAWSTSDVRAAARQPAAPAGDGCAQLAAEVSGNVQHAYRAYRLDGARSPVLRRAAAQIVDGGPVSCGTTAAASSAAFASVMAGYGLQLAWNNAGPGSPGDYCSGHLISQCYPEPRQGGPSFTAADTGFVRDAWYAVQRGVAQHMPFGPQSDLAWFRPVLLAASLQISLDASLAPTLRPGRRSVADRVATNR